MLPFDEKGNPKPIKFSDINIDVRKGIFNQNGKLISEKKTFYDNHQGREFHYSSSNGVKFIQRTYLIDRVGYQIVGGFSNEKDKKDVGEALNSFKILNNPDSDKK